MNKRGVILPSPLFGKDRRRTAKRLCWKNVTHVLAHRGKQMKWEGNRESDNVEDRRGGDYGGGGGFGFGGGRSIGLGTIVIALVASYFLGINPLTVLNFLSGGGGPVSQVEQPA